MLTNIGREANLFLRQEYKGHVLPVQKPCTASSNVRYLKYKNQILPSKKKITLLGAFFYEKSRAPSE